MSSKWIAALACVGALGMGHDAGAASRPALTGGEHGARTAGVQATLGPATGGGERTEPVAPPDRTAGGTCSCSTGATPAELGLLAGAFALALRPRRRRV